MAVVSNAIGFFRRRAFVLISKIRVISKAPNSSGCDEGRYQRGGGGGGIKSGLEANVEMGAEFEGVQ